MDDDLGLDAIITAFLNYSEFSSINYEAFRDTIKIEIALRGDIGEEKKAHMLSRTCQSLQLFYKIAHIEPKLIKMDVVEKEGITILRWHRDIKSLREQELELLVLLLRQEFNDNLVKDEHDFLMAQSVRTRVKNSLLKKIKKHGQISNNIFAYRDEGRVFVFNK
jgi:hypothetical protein